jgi:hypothetical protein
LSWTLLRLASEGRTLAPVRRLLDLDDKAWAGAATRLRAIGHTTGRVYALGAAATMLALADRFD